MPTQHASSSSGCSRVRLAPGPVPRGKQLWTWEGQLVRAWGAARMPARMVIAGFQQPHGRLGLVVVAPLEPTPAVVEWLQATGDVSFVVSPNKQHWWWAAAMKAAFPGSLLVAPLGLARARKTLPVDVRVTPLAGPQDLPGSWPLSTLDLMTVQGLSLLDELVLLHRPSSTLILTDLALNLGSSSTCSSSSSSSPGQQQEKQQQQGGGNSSSGSSSGAARSASKQQQASSQAQGADKQQQQPPQQPPQQQEQLSVSWPVQLYLKLAGGHRRCCLTTPFKCLIDDAGALKDSLDQILSGWHFEQVSMAHGAFISEGGQQAFKDGTAAFVDELLAGSRRAHADAAAGGGGGGGLAGTGTALLVAGTLIGTAVGIGIAGIMQARSGHV